MKILRVNMSDLKTVLEELPEEWKILGGRGLSAKILKAEMPPEADPLGEQARLIIAGGPLAGTLAPSCGRVSVGAKSPLTLGIKESNSGGPAAQKLDRLGIRAIIVEGAPKEDEFFLLHITKDGVTLESAGQYKGLKNYALVGELYQAYDKGSAIISIGIAGERRWKGSSVAFTDMDGHPSRHAGRGGLGAVMGVKGLKAIVIDDHGSSPIELADREAFREAIKGWPEVIKADARVQIMSRYGTTDAIAAMRSIGTAPSKNYSSEQTEDYENLAGSTWEKTNQDRGGRITGCMPGCIVRCSVVYHDSDSKHLTTALEYETIALLGTNLGINDPDVVAAFDRMCDDMGLDTIELGSAMGVAASAGKMEMGDAESALALFNEVEKGTALGAILGNGVVSTAKALGVTRIPAFKGQAIPAHDPRVTKATGVTYHTSPMGADHTAGVSYENFKSKEGQVERSLKVQIRNATMDSLGYCLLAVPEDHKALLIFLTDLVKARYGLSLKVGDLIDIGRETLRTELEFNQGTEFHTAHGPDPEFVRTEPLAPIGNVFDVDPDEIAAIWDRLDTIQLF
ncbi:MAG: aldehyde ferredoxin oxidoreductase [Deltaproteobacteria bacterium]|nr:aldehyde ferredoxin oxidoreductase [Deltaproteobacteria bacterium]MBW2085469.1 aldehyde ferredoxin oxidoreductase [Deltaproteobacteria bacterium]